MSTFELIATKIIKEQELIIGPLAWTQAGRVEGLHIFDQKTGKLSIDSANESMIIDQLVSKYEDLFGRASKEVCKEAVASLIADLPPSDVPSSLQ